jgi:hypothetical protein
MPRGYVLVEGHGEVEAAGNLIARLCAGAGHALQWARPLRWKNLHLRSGVEKGANHIRGKGDADALLLLRDEDDDCPHERGPQIAKWLRELNLPFPSAVVLLHPEYEVLFLPCVEIMSGRRLTGPAGDRPGLAADTRWQGHWEARRGIKEWLSEHFSAGRSSKPSIDQLPLTRLIDIPTLRAASVPCFGTLERALQFLAQGGNPGNVYPPPVP